MKKKIIICLAVGLTSLHGLALKMPPANEVREIIESVLTTCEPEFLEFTELDLFLANKDLDPESARLLVDYAFHLYERNQEERLTAFPSIRQDLQNKNKDLLKKLFRPKLFINPPLTFKKVDIFGKNYRPFFLGLQR